MFRAIGLLTDLQQEITAGRGPILARTASAKFAFVLLQDNSFSALEICSGALCVGHPSVIHR